MEYDDPAHEADLARERRRQLEADISPEDVEAECGWSSVREEWDDDQGDDHYDDDYHDDEDYP
jgi:hypothetical protein